MRTLATEFSNCDRIFKNPIYLCKPTVATVAIILQPVEFNKRRVNLQDTMSGMFTGCNGWNVYKLNRKIFLLILKRLFSNEVK